MYQKIRNKFRERPTLFYACSIVASWAGVGSLMNFRTIALNYGAVPAIIWAVFNSLACILFGLFVDRVPSIRRIMQSKVMFYFIGLLTLFQTWTQMSGIYEIFGDTPIGTSGGMVIVYISTIGVIPMFGFTSSSGILNFLKSICGYTRPASERTPCVCAPSSEIAAHRACAG